MRLSIGLTLVEMMLVIVIMIILITFVGPGILRSRIVANESSALANIKIISNACQLYHINAGTYPGDLATLSNTTPSYLDAQLGSGTKQRYQFIYTFVDEDNFTLRANPISSGLLQGRFFYTDQDGIIRAKTASEAGADDEIIR